jgi:trypsin-like peptidase
MRNLIIVMAGFIGFFILADPSGSQALKIERERVLAVDGEVKEFKPPRSIEVGKGPGKVAEVDIQQPGASAFQLHFKIPAAALRSRWTLQVFDQQNELAWKYSPVSGDPAEAWSDEIAGDSAKLIIQSTSENPPFKISVDLFVVSHAGAVPRSITFPDQRESIVSQQQDIRELGKATARLRFIGDNGKRYVCSGFLISADLFITNQHCPETESEWRSSLVDFDYDLPSAKPTTLRFAQQVAVNRNLDVAIYRLASKLTDRRPLKLSAEAPIEDAALLIIEHPGGEPKQVSITDCRVQGADLEGVSTSKTDFGHLCDTLGGSSGAGVMDLRSKQVVGLHHLGFIETRDQPVNRAVKMGLILNWLAERNPSLISELGR